MFFTIKLMILLDKNFYSIKTIKQKGKGVFAKKEISGGAVVADYLGRLIRIKEEEEYEKQFGNYIMFYNDLASIVPQDIKTVGAHLFNHSCAPNCGILPFQKHILFVSLRKIFPGEEITISYEVEPPLPKENFQYPCFCQSPLCRGTMHVSKDKGERWYRSIRKKQGKNFNKIETPFGQTLKPLKKYPRSLNDFFGYDIFASLIRPPIIISDTKLPQTKILRKKIKNTGQCLYFPKIAYCLFGIVDNMLISAPLTYLKKFLKPSNHFLAK